MLFTVDLNSEALVKANNIKNQQQNEIYVPFLAPQQIVKAN